MNSSSVYRRQNHLLQTIDTRQDGTLAWHVEFDASLMREEFWDTVLMLLESLSPQQREFFLRHYVHCESIAEIACETGKTSASVEQTLCRARNKMRTLQEATRATEPILREIVPSLQIVALQRIAHKPARL